MSEPTVLDKFEARCVDLLRALRGSKRLLIVVVAVALLLDNILVTSVVPIIPSYLYKLHGQEQIGDNGSRTSGPVRDANGKSSCPGDQVMMVAYGQHGSDLIDPTSSSKRFTAAADRCSNPIGLKVAGGCNRDNHCADPSSADGPDASRHGSPRHEELGSENFEVGILFASKSVMQAVTNLFVVGPLTNRIGYSIPMFLGFVIMFFSTLAFAIGESFSVLFLARSLQGIGSACTSVAGMGMLADCYPNDKERGSAMAIALGGLALGVLIGPPFGGVMYTLFGRASPFFILAFLSLFDGLLQLLVLQPKVIKGHHEGASLGTLAKDPYIRICSLALTIANLSVAILEPSLPLWMIDTMNAKNWEQGLAFLPASFSYLIGTSIFGPLGYRLGRWRIAMFGLLSIGTAMLCVPMAKDLDDLIVPNAFIGFGIGMVDCSMMPMLAYLVDIRHTSVYGSVYALGDIAFCLSFVSGPLLSAFAGHYVGFEGLIIITGLICICFSPLLSFLSSPAIVNEEQAFYHGSAVSYSKYCDSE